MDFSEIKKVGNKLCDACGSEDFANVYESEVINQSFSAADVIAVIKLGNLYKSVKNGSKTREEATKEQIKIKEEWIKTKKTGGKKNGRN